MTQEGFRVVAELYRVLATFDPSAIAAASSLPGISDNLRTALLALHQESASRQAVAAKPAGPSSAPAKRKNGGSLDALGVLTDRDRFPTKEALQELARALGIKVRVDVRDSRDCVARRIAAIVAQDRAVRERLYDLLGAARDKQTAGWIDLIRRTS